MAASWPIAMVFDDGVEATLTFAHSDYSDDCIICVGGI